MPAFPIGAAPTRSRFPLAAWATFGDITDTTTGTYDSSSGLASVALNDSGSLVATLELNGDYNGWAFEVGQPPVGSNYISIEAVACYCRGTMILAENGEVPVEDLSIGDRVMTKLGNFRPIKWIGKRSYSGRFALGQDHILPICIKAGALDDNLPWRDLWISPHHAMYLNGVLIEARDLVNGVSIVQAERVDQVEYFHIELTSHDVIIAEGAFSESFIDDDSRDMFHNVHEYREAYGDAPSVPAR